jgi:serine/threonine protein kinase/Flp pilus assembly protein TadD
MIGKTVSHYRILEKLGEGGMGVVYRAEDTKLKREVAIKFLPPHIATGKDERKRFKIEAQAAAALNHMNIATIHTIEEADEKLFIVMEYIEGKELSELVAVTHANAPLQIDDICNYATQIAEGMQVAHKNAIVHRDIKSSNIMITNEGQVKIMDFGLAKVLGGIQVTKAGTTLGTTTYMSPEQFQGKEVDHRTDIWSFGVILYEMLTGQVPFKGDYEQAVIYSILNEDPKSIMEFREDTPPRLTHIVGKSLQKNPIDRYQTTKDLIEELKAIDKSEPSVQEQQFVPTVAVLPFANMSVDKEQEYFCDGIAEDVLNDLTQLEGLHVVARTSSFAVKGKDQDIREVGMKLGAHTIVEGSVRKAGNRLRITVKLINVADGYHLWSERYDRELEDVFAIQDEIAKNIVQSLKIKLSKREKRALAKTKTQDVQAYDFYLRGRTFFHQGRRKSIEYASEMFNRAIKEDPGYTLAYAGLADCYSYLFMYFEKERENIERSVAASKKALGLDPELAEAHAARGLAVSLDRQYDEAEKEFDKAIELNPKLYEAYYFYARTCRQQGKVEKAVRLFEKAGEVRPEDYQAPMFVASAYRKLKLPEKSEAANRRALELADRHLQLNPDDARALYLGAGALTELGEVEKAIEWGKRAIAIDPDDPRVLYNVACIHSLTGKIEQALDYFEKAIESGYASREWIDNDQDLDPIRHHPRFQEALKKLN